MSSLLTQPIVHSLSEARDYSHDKKLKVVIREQVKRLLPTVIWERSSRFHRSALDVARENKILYILEWKDHLVDYRFSLFRGEALRIEKQKNQEADYIVVESDVLRDYLEHEGVDHRKIIVAHNAVAADQFTRNERLRAQFRKDLGINDETILIGYLGSYAFYHDTARLVLAAQLITNRETAGNIKILMVGMGKEYADTRKLAESLGLLNKVLIMKPGVPKEDVPGIHSALDIAVLPGSTDIICPIKVQEYMASSLPSVIPDYACNREVLRDGETGALFRPRDEVALAEKILWLASQRELRAEIGQRAREEAVRRFSWEATWGAALSTILDRAVRTRSSELAEIIAG